MIQALWSINGSKNDIPYIKLYKSLLEGMIDFIKSKFRGAEIYF